METPGSIAQTRWRVTNIFEYAFSDPVNFVDPVGESPLEAASDLFNGFADTLTFGKFGDWVIDPLGLSAFVDRCSSAYTAGKWGGLAW